MKFKVFLIIILCLAFSQAVYTQTYYIFDGHFKTSLGAKDGGYLIGINKKDAYSVTNKINTKILYQPLQTDNQLHKNIKAVYVHENGKTRLLGLIKQPNTSVVQLYEFLGSRSATSCTSDKDCEQSNPPPPPDMEWFCNKDGECELRYKD